MAVRAGALRQTLTQRWLMVVLQPRLFQPTVNRAVTQVEARLVLTTVVAVAARAWLVHLEDCLPRLLATSPAMVGTARRLQLGLRQHPQVTLTFTPVGEAGEPVTNPPALAQLVATGAGETAQRGQTRQPPRQARTEPAVAAGEAR